MEWYLKHRKKNIDSHPVLCRLKVNISLCPLIHEFLNLLKRLNVCFLNLGV